MGQPELLWRREGEEPPEVEADSVAWELPEELLDQSDAVEETVGQLLWLWLPEVVKDPEKHAEPVWLSVGVTDPEKDAEAVKVELTVALLLIAPEEEKEGVGQLLTLLHPETV